jgi:uncharacterized protein (TIGR00369 family)
MKRGKDSLARARDFLAKIPFNALLGLEILRAHPDGITLRCKIRPDLLNSHGALHGGVTASLVDAAVGVAIQHRLRGARPISTVELKVSYFLPIMGGALLARAHLLRVGSTLCVGRVDLTDTNGNLVGTAIVTYIFLDARGVSSKPERLVTSSRKASVSRVVR